MNYKHNNSGIEERSLISHDTFKDNYRSLVKSLNKISIDFSMNIKDRTHFYCLNHIPTKNNVNHLKFNLDENIGELNKNLYIDQGYVNKTRYNIDSLNNKMKFDLLKLKIEKLNHLKDKEVFHVHKKS